MSQPPPPIPDYRPPSQSAIALDLSPEQLQEIAAARQRGKKLRRAVIVATTDAWVSAIFAGVAVLSGCMGIENLIIGLALGGIAFNSFRGAAALKRFDRSAPGRLALNQLVLASVLVLYFSYALWSITRGNSAIVGAIAGNTDYNAMGLDAVGKDMENIRQMVIFAVKSAYITLIIGTLIAQGLTARYYQTRKAVLDDYLDKTPPWVIQLQAAAS